MKTFYISKWSDLTHFRTSPKFLGDISSYLRFKKILRVGDQDGRVGVTLGTHLLKNIKTITMYKVTLDEIKLVTSRALQKQVCKERLTWTLRREEKKSLLGPTSLG